MLLNECGAPASVGAPSIVTSLLWAKREIEFKAVDRGAETLTMDRKKNLPKTCRKLLFRHSEQL